MTNKLNLISGPKLPVLLGLSVSWHPELSDFNTHFFLFESEVVAAEQMSSFTLELFSNSLQDILLSLQAEFE